MTIRFPIVAVFLAAACPAAAFEEGRLAGGPPRNACAAEQSSAISKERPTDRSINLLDYGAIDDNKSNNTAAVQIAVDVAAKSGRALHITTSGCGNGVYRIGPTIDWKSVNLIFDEGAGFANLDGSSYSGSFYKGVGSLPGLMNPQTIETGRRTRAPGIESLAISKPAIQRQSYLQYNGVAPYPYSVSFSDRLFALLGQSSASAGSWAGHSNYANVYNVSNGPGLQMTCTFKRNSQYGGSCSPSPTAINPATGLPYLFGSSIKITGAGVPAGAFVASWADGVIAMGAGTASAPIGWTAASGMHTVTVTPGRSEFNPVSLSVLPVGTTAGNGPKGGMNWYNQSTIGTNISSDVSDQEGYLAGHEFNVLKFAPGLTLDRLHNGSYGLSINFLPMLSNHGANTTYPSMDGLAITGWSGSPSATKTGGQNSAATSAAINGLRIGGPCAGVGCQPGQRSYFQVGINVQDYDVGLIFQSPHGGTFGGKAIDIQPGAGSLVVNDNIVEPVSRTPTSATSPCVVGQHAWDANYEYRCVAANTWKRAALSSW